MGEAVPSPSICVVMTVHNRCETTIKCLTRLDVAANVADAKLTRVVLDADSSDGTWESLSRLRRVEDVFVRTSSDVFWAKGMNVAMVAAWDRIMTCDYVLLINDDTMLRPDGLALMLENAAADRVVVGTTVDPDSAVRTYGGLVRRDRWRRLSFEPVAQISNTTVDTFNANAVLVARRVAETVGPINGRQRYTHSMADIDYGLRIQDAGFKSVLAAGIVGECASNGTPGWLRADASLPERLRRMKEPKGLPPKEWAWICLTHGGPLALGYFLSPWLKLLRPTETKDYRSARSTASP